MIVVPILSLLLTTIPVEVSAPRGDQRPLSPAQVDEVDDRIEAAGSDIGALVKLAEGYDEAGAEVSAKRVFERIIELDNDHEAARAALRHEYYDGRWFESYVELSRYKRKEATRMKERGMVRFLEEWIPEADLPFRRMGWVQNEAGSWADPLVTERERQEAEWTAAGHQFRPDDSTWIAPDEIDNWTAMLWKCGDDWLDLEAANAFHADPLQPWVLTGEHFVVMTTCPWGYGNSARWHADQVYPHLVRLFGVAPSQRTRLFVLSNLTEYNATAAGALNDSEGFSSLHGAYFSDAAQDTSGDQARWLGMGVSYWQADDQSVAGWGPYWLRWAAAQSYVDAIDFSMDTVALYVGPDEDINLQTFRDRFWGEKLIPRWLRYGAASYVERYLPNPEAGEGDDPWTLRNFAFGEIKKAGGLRDLKDVLAFGLTLDDMTGSTRMLHEVGLVVSFLMDGSADDAELQDKLTDFQGALASGDKQKADKASRALERALIKREKAIREYAGL